MFPPKRSVVEAERERETETERGLLEGGSTERERERDAGQSESITAFTTL